jgi:hypothetical protein
MSETKFAGTALRLLCLPLTLAVLTSCGNRHSQQEANVQGNSGGIDEVHNLIEGTNAQIARQGGVEHNAAGKVDPYPHSPGRSHDDDAPTHATHH